MDIRPPKDAVGNELHVGDLVTFQAPGVIAWKVAAIQNGGIHTTQGATPALIRIIGDVTLAAPMGSQINNLLKVVSPGAEDALKRILEASPPPSI